MIHRFLVESFDGTLFPAKAPENERPVEDMPGFTCGFSSLSAFGRSSVVLGQNRLRGWNQVLGVFRMFHQAIKDEGYHILCQNNFRRRRFFFDYRRLISSGARGIGVFGSRR